MPPFSTPPAVLDVAPLIGLLGFLVAFASTVLLTPAVRRIALVRGWGVDLPDGNRKLHAAPTPAIGGVAIAAGFALSLLLLALWPWGGGGTVALPGTAIWFGAAVMVATGLYDDVRGLSFKGKFALQVAVAHILVHAGYRIDASVLPFVTGDGYDLAVISIPLTLLWIVGVINAVNLLDGLDGLAAGVALIAVSALGLVFGTHGEVGLVLIALFLAGALVGFLIFNFNPASIFMGDSGSLFLGYMLAAISLVGVGAIGSGPDPWLALLVPAVALGLPLLDTSLSIIRRVRERKAIFAPDRDHIHHRMAARYPTRGAVLRLYSAAFLFGASSYAISLLPTAQALGVLLFTVFVAVVGVHRLGYHRPTPAALAARAERAAKADGARSAQARTTAEARAAGRAPGPVAASDGVAVSGDGHYCDVVFSTPK